ncbi:MAG: hypothetical protein HDT41_05205, partial [Lachnospiraceae bacterium]|nr:hypothetical protein [Lachnospiraceae bacterium]
SFLPMIAMFNNTVKNISRLLWSGQINRFLNQLGTAGMDMETVCVLLANGAIVLFLFGMAYKKSGLA